MFLTIDRGFESLLAVRTHEGTDVTVGGHVPFQASIGRKESFAYHTLVRLETSVRSQMRLENARRHKGLVTLVASVRLLTGMGPDVLLQMAGLLEGLATIPTLVGPIEHGPVLL